MCCFFIRFKNKIIGIPYDIKYIFSDMGYNFIPSEISAAFALEQLKKLKTIVKIRIKNFRFLKSFFQQYPNFFRVPIQQDKVKTGWLAYPVLLKNNTDFSREDLQINLEKNGIQTRPIFSGNILRQPIMKNKKYFKHKKSTINSNYVMKNGILIGCHHDLSSQNLNYIFKIFNLFFKKNW